MIPYYENDLNNFRIFQSNNMTFPHHMHTHIEILYVLEGSIEVTIGSLTKLLTTGDFSIAFPNRIHSYRTDPLDKSRIILGLFPVEMGGIHMNTLLKEYPSNPFITSNNLHPDISYGLLSCLKERELELTNQDLKTPYSMNQQAIAAYFQLILARILPTLIMKRAKDMQSPSLTARLVNYLSDNFKEPLSLEVLSTHFGISKYSISRIFSEKLNTSFTSYINTLRIDYAKTLLQSTDQDILSISYAAGYENSRTFNREFMKLCSCTPREYRKRDVY